MRRWLFPLLLLVSCGSDEPRPLPDLPAFKVSATRRESQQWLAVKNGKGLGEPRAFIRRETILFPDGGSAVVDTVFDLEFNERAKISADGRVVTNRRNRRTQAWEEVDLGHMGLPRAVGMAMDWPREADRDFSVVPMTLADTQR